MSIWLTIIIPTVGPEERLLPCLDKICAQTPPDRRWELLLVDNAPSPLGLKTLKASYEGRLPLRVLRCCQPGLHAARHTGLFNAKGDCLVYLDDDMLPQPDWLRSLVAAFGDASVTIATGPIRAAQTSPVPTGWASLWRPVPGGGRCLPALSLLEAGDRERDLPAWYAFGGNLAIRKSLIFAGGGFRPDAFPQEQVWRRGDGETGLLQVLHRQGLRAHYIPSAAVIHHFDPSRLTIHALRQRARKEGYSSAYSTLRAPGGALRALARGSTGLVTTLLGSWLLDPIRGLWLREHWRGFLAYGLRYATHPDLRRWVKRPDYLDDHEHEPTSAA